MSSWIREAIKRPGALTTWFKRNRKKLKRLLGYDPFTRKGDIRDKAVRDLIKLYKAGKIRLSKTILRRLYLARTLQRLRRRH
ncbi:MAG: hypothetical protein QW496_03655 [Desulfurococcaceae archaeon]